MYVYMRRDIHVSVEMLFIIITLLKQPQSSKTPQSTSTLRISAVEVKQPCAVRPKGRKALCLVVAQAAC